MASPLLRACACLAMALVLVAGTRADEAEAVNRLKKMGCFVSTLGKKTDVTIPKSNVTDNDMMLLSELNNVTALTLAEAGITDAGFAPVGRLKNLKLLQIAATKISDT